MKRQQHRKYRDLLTLWNPYIFVLSIIVVYTQFSFDKQRFLMIIIIIFKSYPNIWVTIIEKFPAVSIVPLPVFFCIFFPNFPSHFCILSNLIYPSGSGSSLDRFPSIFVCSVLICSFECNFISSTPSSNLEYVGISYSVPLCFSKIALKNFISMA